jgi:hypothetical protein
MYLPHLLVGRMLSSSSSSRQVGHEASESTSRSLKRPTTSYVWARPYACGLAATRDTQTRVGGFVNAVQRAR